jgi:predicted transporter
MIEYFYLITGCIMRMSFNLKPIVFLVHILTSVVFELEHPHQNQSQKGISKGIRLNLVFPCPLCADVALANLLLQTIYQHCSDIQFNITF